MPEHDAPWTPGPWATDPRFPTDVIPLAHVGRSMGGSSDEQRDAAYAEVIAHCLDDDYAKTGWPHRITRAAASANAALTAAAPSLYEALAELVAEFDKRATVFPASTEDAIETARAALALARGETNG